MAVSGQSRPLLPDLAIIEEELLMGKIVECAKVDPSSGCKHVIRGNTEEEVLKNAAEHAKQHGIREVTPELKAKVKAAIRDEK
jgi:predicted small metal-binding protein